MNGAATYLALADIVLTALLSFVVGVALFLIRRYSDRAADRDSTLHSIQSDMRSLREGMSLGAREAVTLLGGRLSVAEDALDQLAERVTEVRADLRATDRTLDGHIRTPGTHAHPPPSYSPVVG